MWTDDGGATVEARRVTRQPHYRRRHVLPSTRATSVDQPLWEQEVRRAAAMAAEQRLNMRFAQFIEPYVCLYDPDDRNYNNRSVTDKAWQEVADEFKITVKQCKEKWKNIRTVFRRHIFGKPLSVSSRKEYYMSEVLQYLVPILRDSPKSMNDSSAFTQNEEDHDAIVRIDENGTVVLSETSCVEDEETTDFPELTYIPNVSVEPSADDKVANFRKIQCRKRKAKPSLNEAMMNYFKSKVNPDEIKSPNDEEDADSQSDHHFLLSLKKDMKEMNARQKRAFKKRIFEVIDEVLDDNPPEVYTPASETSSVNN